VWTNHHYLMRYATEATSRLVWFNFGDVPVRVELEN